MFIPVFWLIFRNLLGRCNREICTCQACDAGSKAKTVVARGAAVLDSYWLTCYKQVLVAPASGIMEVRSIHGLFCLRLRAFGDGFVLVGRFRIIMLYFAYAEYESFYFFVYFSGSVDAFRLWDPGGNVNWRSSRMARGSTSSHQ